MSEKTTRRPVLAGLALRLMVGVVMSVSLLAGVGCTASPRAGEQVTPTLETVEGAGVIRFVKRHDLPLARTSVNGRHVGFFLIDTGASVTVLDRKLGQRMGLETVGRGRVTGIGGSQDVDIARIDHLQIDQVWFHGHEVRLVDLSQIQQSLGWPIAGILGINLLGEQPFTIDYEAARVTLYSNRGFTPPAGARPFPLRMIGRIPAVLTTVGEGNQAAPLWLQIDSGMNAQLAIPRQVLDANPRLLSGMRHSHQASVGVGGTAANIRSELAMLTLMGRDLRDTPVMIETRPPTPPFQNIPVGRVGNRLLDQTRLTFDVPNQVVYVEWLER